MRWGEGLRRNMDFGKPNVCLGVQHLTLQVREFNPVGIHKSDDSHASGSKVQSDMRTKTTSTNDKDMRASEFFLPCSPDIRQNHRQFIATEIQYLITHP